ncbi:recombinase family protein [Agromyces sp. S2-1-8]|uniref:recombinase family protein n=1 Tax=Agromyces sp. S2-1-8 TaxID=2897180 RepID=UPI001E63FAD0|nr:recombinase family protein [Agromyces sp. S2-1-8]MCD5346735.1 recombinase family protein [Agromyces sp. S2-1-8]
MYLRISKDDARTGLAVERQRSECEALIARRGWTLVETYVDNGVSAYARNVKRPAYDRMALDYEAGEFDAVVCWDADRLTRQPEQLERWIRVGESRGLVILTATEEIDLSTDNGRLFARIKSAVARAEVERKSARQKAQAAQARAAGKMPAGLRPFGFDQDGVTVRESEAVWLRECYRMILAGDSVRACVRKLNEKEVKTRLDGPWQAVTLKRALERPRNRGRIVPEAEFDTAVGILAARRTKAGRPARKAWLSGIIKCGVCGSGMLSHHGYYHCARKVNAPGVDPETRHVSINGEVAESKVSAFVYGFQKAEPPKAEPKPAVTASKLAAIEAEMSRVTELALLPGADVSVTGARLAELAAERDELDAQRGEELAAGAGLAALATLPDSGENALEWLEAWKALDSDKRREIVRSGYTVTVTKGGKGSKRVQVVPR